MPKSLKYDDSSLESIVNYASKLVGKSIDDILKTASSDFVVNSKNKGLIGIILEEYYFGIKANSSPKPDFEKVGVELKIIPLIQQKKALVVKERTKICSINYTTLVDESWNSSHAKEKLNKILFIYYLYDKTDFQKSKILKVDLWELSKGNSELLIQNDWENIQKKVIEGFAHTLSESDSEVLAASRSGSGGKNKAGKLRDLVPQANKNIEKEALKRAFSLKQSFTNQRWKELESVQKYESIIDSLQITNFDSFESKVLAKINEYEKKSIQELSDIFELNIKTQSKNQIATIIKKSIGFLSVKSKIKEFEQLGISVKTLKLRQSDMRPLESVSFPSMDLREFSYETWENSVFREMISKILFVPVYHNGNSLEEKYLGKSFFWSPTPQEELIIAAEWKEYQNEVLNGNCRVRKISNKSKRGYKEVSSLSKESATTIIHMRPHGRDSDDRDEDIFANSIVKQSFWLNKNFIQNLLKTKG